MGWKTGVPPFQPHISMTNAATTFLASAPSDLSQAREPAVVALPVDSASSPSKETKTKVRVREGSRPSARASSMSTPTPPLSS